MIDKFEKRENCEYCEKPLEAKYRNKRFCSDKCYFGRANKTPANATEAANEAIEDVSNEKSYFPKINEAIPKPALMNEIEQMIWEEEQKAKNNKKQ
jgi:hypothetical protein